MWNIDLKQMQQYYGTWVTLREMHMGHTGGIGQGKETKNLNVNVVDVLTV
jgi:hypothetical protein